MSYVAEPLSACQLLQYQIAQHAPWYLPQSFSEMESNADAPLNATLQEFCRHPLLLVLV